MKQNYSKNEILTILKLERERTYNNYITKNKNSNAFKEFNDMDDVIELVEKSKLNYFYNVDEVNRAKTKRNFTMINVGDLMAALFFGIVDHKRTYQGYDIKYLSRKNRTTPFTKKSIVFNKGHFYEYSARGERLGLLW